MDKVIIKPMTLECLKDILEIERLSFSVPWSKESFIEELTQNPFALYLVASVGDKVVGYIGMWKVLDEGHITNIAVHPNYRGRKIGSALLEELIRRAEELEISSMTLEVRKSNIVAQALYKKYGFEVEGLRKAYYSDNQEDALIMWRRQKRRSDT